MDRSGHRRAAADTRREDCCHRGVTLVEANHDSTDDGSARAIRRERLVDGKIGRYVYSERSALLTAGRRARTVRPAWRYAVATVVGVLVVGLLVGCSTSTTETDGRMPMIGPMDGMQDMHGMMGSRATTDAGPAATFPDAARVTVEADDMWFDPTTIEIVEGEPINLTLTNHGQLFHDLVVDDLDIRLAADAGTTTTSGLLVERPGEYEFICSVPGHAAAGMRGTLVVRPAVS